MKSCPRLVVLFLALSGFVAGGCGEKSDLPELGSVSGIVTLDGAPLPEANVEFRPEKGRPSSGMTDSEGKYTLLYTFEAPGALIGTHTVLISTARYAAQPDGSAIQIPEKVPVKYNEKTTLSKEVKAGSNQFNFELTSK